MSRSNHQVCAGQAGEKQASQSYRRIVRLEASRPLHHIAEKKEQSRLAIECVTSHKGGTFSISLLPSLCVMRAPLARVVSRHSTVDHPTLSVVGPSGERHQAHLGPAPSARGSCRSSCFPSLRRWTADLEPRKHMEGREKRNEGTSQSDT